LLLSFYRVCWNCHFTGCVGTVIIPLLPPIFGRAAITLGIGPHSSICLFWFHAVDLSWLYPSAFHRTLKIPCCILSYRTFTGKLHRGLTLPIADRFLEEFLKSQNIWQSHGEKLIASSALCAGTLSC